MRVTNDNYKVNSAINFKNVYLDNNRICTLKKVNRVITKISIGATITEMADSVRNFIKRIFNKK